MKTTQPPGTHKLRLKVPPVVDGSTEKCDDM
jgi:hypothetical protein